MPDDDGPGAGVVGFIGFRYGLAAVRLNLKDVTAGLSVAEGDVFEAGGVLEVVGTDFFPSGEVRPFPPAEMGSRVVSCTLGCDVGGEHDCHLDGVAYDRTGRRIIHPADVKVISCRGRRSERRCWRSLLPHDDGPGLGVVGFVGFGHGLAAVRFDLDDVAARLSVAECDALET